MFDGGFDFSMGLLDPMLVPVRINELARPDRGSKQGVSDQPDKQIRGSQTRRKAGALCQI